MGILWRLLAPRPLKNARRTVRKAAHPVRTASWALSPKPVKQIRRAAFKVANPLEAAEFAVENQVVNSLRGGQRRSPRQRPRTAAAGAASASAGTQSVDVTWLPGGYEIPVAGLEHHEMAVLETLAAVPRDGQMDAVLLPEPANPHDSNAVAVYMAGGLVGYVPRRIAAVLQPALTEMSAAQEGLPAGCPARVDLGAQKARIVLLIDLAEIGVDPGALESGQS